MFFSKKNFQDIICAIIFERNYSFSLMCFLKKIYIKKIDVTSNIPLIFKAYLPKLLSK